MDVPQAPPHSRPRVPALEDIASHLRLLRSPALQCHMHMLVAPHVVHPQGGVAATVREDDGGPAVVHATHIDVKQVASPLRRIAALGDETEALVIELQGAIVELRHFDMLVDASVDQSQLRRRRVPCQEQVPIVWNALHCRGQACGDR